MDSIAELAKLDEGWLFRSSWLGRFARQQLLAKLQHLRYGRLRLIDQGEEYLFASGQDEDLQATVRVHDPRFYNKIAFGGSIGAGEAFMSRLWTTDDLTAVARLMVRNREVLNNLEGGWARLSEPFHKVFHRVRANSRRGSRRNIAAHYDLSNDFFGLFLDRRMMYSSAVYNDTDTHLDQASEAKLDRICRKLDLSETDHVLEIGTGWGGFARYAAENYGCRVTTTTISSSQFAHAREEIQRAGLQDRVDIVRKDYRDLDGQYDKLVSIEMIEAVGHNFLETFFRVCSERLKPDGLMLLQAITIADRFYDQAKRSVDFIQRYIFPGSALPSIGSMVDATRATDLTMAHLEDIGLHYARTLRDWRLRLGGRLDELHQQGFSDAFARMWEFYFCYCEAGFLERSVSDVQMLLAKPRHSQAYPLGELA